MKGRFGRLVPELKTRVGHRGTSADVKLFLIDRKHFVSMKNGLSHVHPSSKVVRIQCKRLRQWQFSLLRKRNERPNRVCRIRMQSSRRELLMTLATDERMIGLLNRVDTVFGSARPRWEPLMESEMTAEDEGLTIHTVSTADDSKCISPPEPIVSNKRT